LVSNIKGKEWPDGVCEGGARRIFGTERDEVRGECRT
jgi:hypothetical protein